MGTETVFKDRFVYVDVPSSTTNAAASVSIDRHVGNPLAIGRPAAPAAEARLMQVRGTVLRWGVDALPAARVDSPDGKASPPLTTGSDRQQFDFEGI
jgi:hypothetical protein